MKLPPSGPLHSQPLCYACGAPVWTPKPGTIRCYYCDAPMTVTESPAERERRLFEDVVATSGTTYVDCSFAT